jgi:hypothetical protein
MNSYYVIKHGHSYVQFRSHGHVMSSHMTSWRHASKYATKEAADILRRFLGDDYHTVRMTEVV